ncbi:MAG TPA: DUF222 domain-containing protein [Microbacteriaceae bacterium]|jgi:Domain of unknown function DUF222.
MSPLTELLTSLEAIATTLPSDSTPFGGLSDGELLEVPAAVARIRHRLDATAAIAAGEIARRSRHELGYAGLAQRSGFRTPAGLLQKMTGESNREASKLVRVGVMIHEAEDARRAGSDSPLDGHVHGTNELGKAWLAPIAEAVARAAISVEAAEAIRVGLGEPSDSVAEATLTDTAARLVELAGDLNIDELTIRARTLREDLDEAGISAREAERKQRRSLRVFRQSDGMTRLTWLMDPESATIVTQTYDQLTSPRRGGPRWVDEAEKARADAIVADSRTTEQIASDGFLQLLVIAAQAAPNSIIGTRRPATRVLVTEQTLRTGSGHGRLDGQLDAASLATIQRGMCDTGILPIAFTDDGQCVNVGREKRLFTDRQKIGLSARDGGCRWPGCDRPPLWTEAHHIDEWLRDGGKTDLADGICLCRYHHMLLHDNHWRITRTGADYWLIPPLSEDRSQTPIAMPSKSVALRDLMRQQKKRTG